ncbi:MAG: hypothetical protein JNL70_27640 [Saprospiraceae bacterium]|nr:hypothetical protein [Saprospiraceae bacterium]
MLKRFAAISFLLLLLFNAFGYYLLFGYEQAQAREQVIQNIQNMPESSFMVVKMLVSPYAHVEDRDFEYVEGEFRKDGKTYNFVKKRIKNDSLELYCLNNIRQDQLTAQFNDYVKENLIQGKSSQNVPMKQMLKSFLKDYIPLEIYSLILFKPFDTEGVLSFSPTDDALPIVFLSTTTPPPNRA